MGPHRGAIAARALDRAGYEQGAPTVMHRHTPRCSAGWAPREVGRLPFHQLTSHDRGAHSHEMPEVRVRHHACDSQANRSARGPHVRPPMEVLRVPVPSSGLPDGAVGRDKSTHSTGGATSRTEEADGTNLTQTPSPTQFPGPSARNAERCCASQRRVAAHVQRGMSGPLAGGLRLVGGGGVGDSLRLAPQCGLNAISDSTRQLVRPLVHGLVADAYCLGGSWDGSAQEIDGLGFKHDPLNHSSRPSATMVPCGVGYTGYR